MYNECRHIFTSGRKCQSPALRDQNFCYFHSNTRKRPTPANQPYDPYTDPKESALALTPLEDAAAIQLAVSEVVLALAANRIDARRARILIYGLQVASQNQRHRAAMAAKENISTTTVRETHQHEDGTLIGPVKETPDPEEEAEQERPSLGRILLQEAEAMKAERDARRARGEDPDEEETVSHTLPKLHAVSGISSADPGADTIGEPLMFPARTLGAHISQSGSPERAVFASWGGEMWDGSQNSSLRLITPPAVHFPSCRPSPRRSYLLLQHSSNIGGCRRETTWPTTTCATGSKRSTKPES